MKNICIAIIAGTLFIVAGQVLAAANFAHGNPMWGNLGIGIKYSSDSSYIDHNGYRQTYTDSGPAGEISFNMMTTPNQLLTVGMLSGTSFLASNFQSYQALYGLIHKERNGYISGSVGVAYTSIDFDELFDLKFGRKRNIMTANAELQAFWTPTDYFGVGVIVPGLIGARFSAIGALLAIQFGRLQ